jgi:hypothetical protein
VHHVKNQGVNVFRLLARSIKKMLSGVALLMFQLQAVWQQGFVHSANGGDFAIRPIGGGTKKNAARDLSFGSGS